VDDKSPITDYVATAEGGFLNLVTGEVLGVTEMLCRFSRAEVETVPIGHRHQQKAFRRRPPDQTAGGA
jgi:hypothetical protein